MNSESNIPKESSLVEVREITPETEALVNDNMSDQPENIRRETMELIDAIKKRAQSELQSAGNLTRDSYVNAVQQASETYLNTVRQARTAIQQEQPLIEKDRIEYSLTLMQMEAEKNWESIVKEVSTLGDRLTEAAKAAWEVLTAPRDDSSNV